MTIIFPKSTDQSPQGLEMMEHKLPYPKSVIFIAVTEFCERFSYYGMRAVLTIYMRNVLNFSENLSTTIYHVFLLLCYALPVLGGILADSFIGKYKTVLYISIVYAMGNLVLSLSSITPLHLPQVPLSLLGLFLMAIGTGGIKPCVVALGGEQFVLPYQEKQLRQYFSVFLFAVSVGNMLSTVITPIFRRDVSCFGDDTCYPLAFGVPASLMLVAVVVFVCGKSRYNLVEPDGNIMVKVVKCMSYAIKEKSRDNNNDEKKSHWLDYARNKFDLNLINDTKGLLRVLVYYIPIPMFFALYEQLGSRWTLQATRMDGLVGGYTIKPDQMQVANAILMFIFIPFFEAVVYPILRKCNIFKRPLQRMGVGGILAALSFLSAGIVERSIESSYSLVPKHGEIHLNFINTLPCPVIIFEHLNNNNNNNNNNMYDNGTNDNHNVDENILTSQIIIQTNENYIYTHSLKMLQPINFTIQLLENNTNCIINQNLDHNNNQQQQQQHYTKKWNGQIIPIYNTFQSLIISYTNTSLSLDVLPTPDDIHKSKEGNSKLRIVFNNIPSGSQNLNTTNNNNTNETIEFDKTIRLINSRGEMKTLNLYPPSSSKNSSLRVSWTFEVDPDRYRLIMLIGKNRSLDKEISKWFDVKTGGNYIIGITHDNYTDSTETQVITITPPNTIHMLWLVPQYVLMAWGEVLFIISGVEFSFTEAPASMKSVVQSCWHLTNAFGNLIVILSAQFNLPQASEFFVFSAVMGIDIVLFALLAIRYKYVTPENSDKLKPIENNQEKLEESTL